MCLPRDVAGFFERDAAKNLHYLFWGSEGHAKFAFKAFFVMMAHQVA